MAESRILVGNAPVSWGVYEADRPNPPFAQVLDEIAAAGYEGTELGPYGYLPTSPGALAAELKKRDLRLGSSFVPLPLEDASRRGRSVEAALAVGKLLHEAQRRAHGGAGIGVAVAPLPPPLEDLGLLDVGLREAGVVRQRQVEQALGLLRAAAAAAPAPDS